MTEAKFSSSEHDTQTVEIQKPARRPLFVFGQGPIIDSVTREKAMGVPLQPLPQPAGLRILQKN